MGFNQIAWLPLCVAVTAVGLVFSYLALRRRGVAAGLRMAAWSLLPMAAYLTGALQSIWTIGATVVSFVTSLIFNPLVWAGVAVTGLSVVLFVVSGVMRGRKLRRTDGGKQPKQAEAVQPSAKPATPAGRPAVQAPKKDDDFSDIEDILKRRGIS
ncbi:cellulose synthase [Nonomuraea sp. NPDC050536]|uniref:cellulose synthase n=1 Tax=Nonomuraea sp. NPDC050536 TaxID=3364366 RepID=UPI0037C98D88